MDDYIKKQEALTELNKTCHVCMALVARPMCGDCSVADTVCKITSIPPAEVKLVVRGEWICTDDDYNIWMCSVCKEEQLLTAGTPRDNSYHFCPNCGAEMREEVNDERGME